MLTASTQIALITAAIKINTWRFRWGQLHRFYMECGLVFYFSSEGGVRMIILQLKYFGSV